MARRTNYGYEKRQRELKKQKKAEEKRERKMAKKQAEENGEVVEKGPPVAEVDSAPTEGDGS